MSRVIPSNEATRGNWHTYYTSRKRGHACVFLRGRGWHDAFLFGSRNWTTRLKLSPTLFQGKNWCDVWVGRERERERNAGGERESASSRISLLLVRPLETPFRRRGRKHEGAAPRLSALRYDATVCNRQSCARIARV